MARQMGTCPAGTLRHYGTDGFVLVFLLGPDLMTLDVILYQSEFLVFLQNLRKE